MIGSSRYKSILELFLLTCTDLKSHGALLFVMVPCKVHYKFELMDETLFLTVNIIDRFLEKQVVPRKKLQLVGVTAMLLACKYEEVSVPVVEDLVIISDRAYTRGQILEMVIPLYTLCALPLNHLTVNCRHIRSNFHHQYATGQFVSVIIYVLLHCCFHDLLLIFLSPC